MSSLPAVVATLKDTIPAALRLLGGIPENKVRALSISYTEEMENPSGEQGFDVIAEVTRVVADEAKVKLLYDVLRAARDIQHRTLTVKFDNDASGRRNFVEMVILTATSFGPRSTIVVSPQQLMMIMVAATHDIEFVQAPRETKIGSGLAHVGTLQGFPVIVDAGTPTPDLLLILAPNWFTFTSGEIATGSPRDGGNNTRVITIGTDVVTKVDPSKVKILSTSF